MGVVSMSSDSIAGPSEAPQPPATPTTGAHGCFSHRDVKCGTLLCLSDNTSPVLGDGSYSLFFGRFKCKAVIASNDANEVVAKLRLVPTGAKCGEEMVSVLAALVGWWGGGVTTGCGDPGAASDLPCLSPGLLCWALPEPPGLRQQELLGQVQQPWGMLWDRPLPEQLWGLGGGPSPYGMSTTLTLSFLISGVQPQAGVSLRARLGSTLLRTEDFGGGSRYGTPCAWPAPAPLSRFVCQEGSLGRGSAPCRGAGKALLHPCGASLAWRGACPNADRSPQGAAAWSWRLCWPCWGSLASCSAVGLCSSEAGGRGAFRKGNSHPPPTTPQRC